MKIFNSLTIKFFFFFLLVAFVPLLGFVFFIVPQAENYIKDEAKSEYSARIDERTSNIYAFFDRHKTQVLSMLSLPPIQGLIRAEETGIDPLDGSTYAEWHNRLEAIFRSIIEADDSIYQIRYIDEFGDEFVRVNNTNTGVYFVPESEYQNKSELPFFKGTMQINGGSVFVSEIDLNVEYGEIEEPYVPVTRFAVPVFNEENDKREGILIINIKTQELLYSHLDVPKGVFYLTTVDGEVIMHPDEARRFSHQLGGMNLFDEFPWLQTAIKGSISIQGEEMTGDDVFFWRKVFYGEGQGDYVLYIAHVSKTELYSLVNRFRNTLYPFIVVLGVLLLFGSLILGRVVIKPLAMLQGIAQKVTKEDFNISVDGVLVARKDEIGVLAKALATMATRLKALYGSLERQVRDKTRELEEVLVKTKEQNATLAQTRTAMLNVLEDVAEERDRAERQKTRLDLALSAATIGTWEWDVASGRLTWDDNMFVLYGIARSDFSNSYDSYKNAVHPEDRARAEQELNDAVSGKKDFDTEFRIVTPTKEEKVIRARAKVIFNDQSKAERMIGVNWDITAEAQIDRAKTEFVSLASHQLRTPLSSINWFAEMLSDGDAGKLNKQQQEFVHEIYVGSRRMTDLVGALLNVSRIELGTFAIEPEEMLLDEIIVDVEKELAHVITERKQTFTKRVPRMKPIMLDRKLMHMIIENLVSNAVKYTPEGGSISLTVARKAEQLVISVKDTGLGIPLDQQHKIFSKLFRADNVTSTDTQGTGLGLYIVKSVIEASGGTITFTSQENKGTTFTVTYPLSGMQAKKGTRGLDTQEGSVERELHTEEKKEKGE